jgi:hypothetical protein
MIVAQWVVRIAMLYAALGLVSACVFSLWGVERVDPAARKSHPLFRVFIIPGVAALWPLMLLKWARALRGSNPAGGRT